MNEHSVLIGRKPLRYLEQSVPLREKSKEDWEFRAAKVRESIGGMISELTDDMVVKDIFMSFLGLIFTLI